jgi:hypothetical protein
MIFIIDNKISGDNSLLICCQIVCNAIDVPTWFGVNLLATVVEDLPWVYWLAEFRHNTVYRCYQLGF